MTSQLDNGRREYRHKIVRYDSRSEYSNDLAVDTVLGQKKCCGSHYAWKGTFNRPRRGPCDIRIFTNKKKTVCSTSMTFESQYQNSNQIVIQWMRQVASSTELLFDSTFGHWMLNVVKLQAQLVLKASVTPKSNSKSEIEINMESQDWHRRLGHTKYSKNDKTINL